MRSAVGASLVVVGLVLAFKGGNFAGLLLAAIGAAILITDERRSNGSGPLR